MNNKQEETKKAVLNAVRDHARQTHPNRMRVNNGPKALGLYLQKCLKRRDMSRVAFAQALDMETELADAILDGVLPDSELHPQLLHELAEAADGDYNHLVQLLKSDASPSMDGRVSFA